MSATYTCDKCGKELRCHDIFTVTVKRAGSAALPRYMFCEECSCLARAAVDAFLFEGEETA